METDRQTCFLCGSEQTYSEMRVVASPSIGPRVDLALTATWFCVACFGQNFGYKHAGSPVGQFVYQKQDKKRENILSTVRQILEDDPQDEITLPHGLRVSSQDKERLSKGLEIGDLQDTNLQRAALNLYRNKAKAPFFNPVAGTIKDYNTLVGDFRKLEEIG